MNKHLRVHVGRRRQAIDRLQTLTTGAVVAGVAGTLGFGVLAAATFTGKSSVQAATSDETQPPTAPFESGSGPGANQDNGNAAVPTPRALAVTPTPRPTRAPKPHAATGGSG